jgi:hypothetical protein
MKTLSKAIGISVLVLFGTLASGSAMAQHHGGGHGFGGGHVRFGVSVGVPIFGFGYWPYYGYPYAYPAYGYPAPAYGYPVAGAYAAPAYVEQGAQAAPAPAQAQGDWYYCAASRTYYPYVGECPAGWQRVPAQPSR